jgi:Ca2+-binding RTX toxin-like protein
MDVAHGNSGNDQLYGQDDSDYLYGESGSDKLVGGYGADYLDSHDGVAGNDTVWGDNENGTGGGGGIIDVVYMDLSGGSSDALIGIESASY